ncbi:FAD:protein FMN transferase [Halomonas sp. MCCC 1A17488]|uniref:FAD:protein FMN transferase n=1 Tax=unclassified Halomonas TaxID=2609666 RepID=UPI0018D25CC0|nr:MULTISPECIES: FAD:protein FMN transferase [unclassified Halomonas]MCE8017297.1 FAD:protein FMN transferase [Halomonas sp. MCCC 1A17488]MCG3240630.1 FAD:protein FMN transferase [Halomonas sp. MCCC 1A17488]QPP49523.1 FAD:protein FMN transferase [Halomonas sp. SS10-MC5]
MNPVLRPVVISVLFLGLLLAGCSESDRPLESPVRLEGSIFGTFYQVTIADSLTQGQARELEEGLLEVLEQVDAAMSIYRDDSELMAFNQAPLGEWQPLSNELIEVLAISQSVAEASDGAFDVTLGGLVNLWSFGSEARPREVPDDETLEARLAEVGPDSIEVDENALQARRLRDVFVNLGGVAKGHATDRVAAYLDAEGIEHYLVNLGGDLITRGYRDRQAEPWRIGIEAPLDDRQEATHIVPLHDISVATSGDYRNYFEENGQRFSHTIDPRSGRPIEHRVASVTVAHPSNAWADAWATAMMVLGEEGLELAREQGLKVLLLVREDEGWSSVASPAFADYLGGELSDEMGLEVR